MLARIFRALLDDVDSFKARKAIPALVFVGIAIVLLAVQVEPQYRHSRDMAATVLVLALLLFGIYGAFAWGEPPERGEARSEGSNTD